MSPVNEKAFLTVDSTRKKLYKYEQQIDRFNIGIGDRILDLCCGTGLYTKVFQKKGCEHVFGCDYSLEILKQRRELSAVCGDAYHLSFKARSFDIVFIGRGLHHLNEMDVVLHELHRILKQDGRLVFIEPAKTWLRSMGHILIFSPLSRFSKTLYAMKMALEEEKRDYFSWLSISKREIEKIFANAGFILDKWEVDHLYCYAVWSCSKKN